MIKMDLERVMSMIALLCMLAFNDMAAAQTYDPTNRAADPYATGPTPIEANAGRGGYVGPDGVYRPAPRPGADPSGWRNPDGEASYPNAARHDPGYDPRRGGYVEPPAPPRGGGRYDPPPGSYDRRNDGAPRNRGTYSQNEVVDAGHRFFGSISQGLANAVEYAFKQAGRPNGYILGEDAGGAFIAGLRYGEGVLYTKDSGRHRVYWQGPSVGYDFGGEGSKTMMLVYRLRHPSDIYNRFGGVQGSAYLVGGVSVQFQNHGHVSIAVIRSGIGLRLGANLGYLKYTRRPTWNPF